ncbi:MAG: PIN domain-containing protein [Comamonadaceae bacterium]|nr:PIN domain-containing protein [Comamonadaceae bacterium]
MRSGLAQDDLLGRYLNVAVVVEPSSVPRVVPDDPDDDQVLACALAAQVEMIVSGDKHLLDLGGHYQNIPIVTLPKPSNSSAYR